MGVLATLTAAGNLIASFIIPTLELALKFKTNAELTPDFSVNITNLSGEAISADDATTAAIATWKQQNNLS